MLWDSRLTTDFAGVVAAKYVHRQAQFCLRFKAESASPSKYQYQLERPCTGWSELAMPSGPGIVCVVDSYSGAHLAKQHLVCDATIPEITFNRDKVD